MARLAAYTRCSTQDQATHGLGLQAQRQRIRKWAKDQGHTIKLWAADEGISGSNGLDTRRGLYEAMAAVESGDVDGLVVYRLDRLARDFVLQETLIGRATSCGRRIYSTERSEDDLLDPEGVEDDPSRELVRQVLGALAAYERRMTRMRMTAGKAVKAARGGYLHGAPPFGYRAEGGDLVPDEEQQKALKLMRELHAQGASLRTICAALEVKGHKPKRGERWHSSTVGKIVARAPLQGPSTGSGGPSESAPS